MFTFKAYNPSNHKFIHVDDIPRSVVLATAMDMGSFSLSQACSNPPLHPPPFQVRPPSALPFQVQPPSLPLQVYPLQLPYASHQPSAPPSPLVSTAHPLTSPLLPL